MRQGWFVKGKTCVSFLDSELSKSCFLKVGDFTLVWFLKLYYSNVFEKENQISPGGKYENNITKYCEANVDFMNQFVEFNVVC